jgi:hypothetical protein
VLIEHSVITFSVVISHARTILIAEKRNNDLSRRLAFKEFKSFRAVRVSIMISRRVVVWCFFLPVVLPPLWFLATSENRGIINRVY